VLFLFEHESTGEPHKQTRLRIDRVLVERGFAETREKAQALIIAGQVLVDGQKKEKAGALVSETAEIAFSENTCPT